MSIKETYERVEYVPLGETCLYRPICVHKRPMKKTYMSVKETYERVEYVPLGETCPYRPICVHKKPMKKTNMCVKDKYVCKRRIRA